LALYAIGLHQADLLHLTLQAGRQANAGAKLKRLAHVGARIFALSSTAMLL
jgi:hypothetical protein